MKKQNGSGSGNGIILFKFCFIELPINPIRPKFDSLLIPTVYIFKFHFYYYYYYYYNLLLLSLLLFTPLEFFTPALADGLSLEFERQQVSSSLQDTSQYCGRSQKCCHLEGLYSAANFQVLQFL